MAEMPNGPCKNPACRSYGRVHPHCACYHSGFAKGGEVHYCDSYLPHDESCEHFADGGTVEFHHEFIRDPDLAIDHAVASHGLHHLLTKTGHSKSENPYKTGQDFLDSSKHGRKTLQGHVAGIFGAPDKTKADPERITALKSQLQHYQENPQALLTGPGTLHDSHPDHATALGAKTAQAVNYFATLKPLGSQNAPLDQISPPNRAARENYDRQLAIAEHPMTTLQLAKQGRLQPQDIVTLKTLYPKLAQSMVNGVVESLVNAQIEKKRIPYKERIGLSQLIGQPLDSTMSTSSMQAIIKSQAPSQQPNQAPQKRATAGATAATQKTIKEADDLYLSPLQARQVSRRS